MRLDKFIANSSEYSRTEVRALLKAGRVRINGEVVAQAATKLCVDRDRVSLDDTLICATAPVFLMLNKPPGYVCANKDAEHPTVLDLIKQPSNSLDDPPVKFALSDIQIAGRLDIDTTGLVLLTSDGRWNHRITSPSVMAKKVYRVTVEQGLEAELIEKFRQGVELKGETRKTRPALLAFIDQKNARLSLSEGRYHQVKRMFAAVGNHVLSLHRESIAGISLDAELPPGKYRALRPEELAAADLAMMGESPEGKCEKPS